MEATLAIEALIAHIKEQELNRQKAKDAGRRSYKPTEEEKAERLKLLRGVIWSLQLTRKELLAKLDITRATWDRWRIMKTIPSSEHREAIMRLVPSGAQPQEGSMHLLISKVTTPMLAVLGITKEKLAEIEWLERMQRAAGIPLTEKACSLLLEEFQAANASSS